MATVQWEKEEIHTDQGQVVSAVAPVVVSASRATDIPAFYPEWMINRLRAGYARWVNPFNGVSQYISFTKTRLIVFWTKNPEPFIPFLEELETRGIHYFFHFTLNDYDKEGYEPGVPELSRRIETFIDLSRRIGKEKVLWRFDPLLLSDRVNPETLIQKVRRVGDMIHPYTSRLTVSFFSPYAKVLTRCRRKGIEFQDVTEQQGIDLISVLKQLTSCWELNFHTCGEKRDFSPLGVERGRCIDERHVAEIFADDVELMRFLNPQWDLDLFGKGEFRKGLRDSGQRKYCGCMKSKDIGRYNTCPHGCVYCYANASSYRLRIADQTRDILAL
ncbi:MAG: DUF1848 domain-containing protein [Chitinispirillaceae bacterium]